LILMTREAGVDLGSIARPLIMSLQTKDWNLILMTRAVGGGVGCIARSLTSLLIQTRVLNLIPMKR
jgi:hypothetical protein